MLNNPVDLRSDTITKPTVEMRRAIAAADVGDDVLGDDPTVCALEERTAAILGKEAALFVASGTMANQVAIRVHTQPGDELLVDANAHIYWYEAGAPAALSGVTCTLLPGVRGIFCADDVRAALRPENVHFPRSSLLCFENTHNRGGGSVWPIDRLADIAGVAGSIGLRTHMDGARLWNAVIASGVSEAAFARHVDSVSVCFSKGLGAPVGSALAGTREFIDRARRIRKQFGGGMRQAGIIAAGALYALEHHRERLAEDHANAQRLACGIAELRGIELDPSAVATNIVYFDTPGAAAEDVVSRLDDAGVLMLPTGPNTVRAVTSLAVDSEGIEHAVRSLRRIAGSEGNA